MTLIAEIVNTTYDGCTLQRTYDDTTFDEATDSYRITAVTASNPTGTNGFPPRTLTAWATYKGKYVSTTVAPGTIKAQTFSGNRTIADVTEYGLS